MLHLSNETGERPLRETIPVCGIRVKVKLPGDNQVQSVKAVIEEQQMTWKQDGEWISIDLKQLDVWEMLTITF